MICTGKFGLIIGTSLYAGKQDVLGESSDNDMPKSGSVVWELAKALPYNKNFQFAFDNLFYSPILMHRLFGRGIQCIATFQINSFRGLTFYRIKIDNRKRFSLRIFFHYADLAVINSWLLYRRDSDDYAPKQQTIDLWEFKSRSALALCSINQSKKNKLTNWVVPVLPMLILFSPNSRRGPAKPMPEKETRSDQYGHRPEFCKGKFPDCKGIIQTQCSKCETYLCFTKDKNCFKNFHLQKL